MIRRGVSQVNVESFFFYFNLIRWSLQHVDKNVFALYINTFEFKHIFHIKIELIKAYAQFVPFAQNAAARREMSVYLFHERTYTSLYLSFCDAEKFLVKLHNKSNYLFIHSIFYLTDFEESHFYGDSYGYSSFLCVFKISSQNLKFIVKFPGIYGHRYQVAQLDSSINPIKV